MERHEDLRLELRTRYESLFAYKTRVQLGRGEGSFHCKAWSIDSTPRKHNKMISSRLYRCQRPFNGVFKTRSSGKESRLRASSSSGSFDIFYLRTLQHSTRKRAKIIIPLSPLSLFPLLFLIDCFDRLCLLQRANSPTYAR